MIIKDVFGRPRHHPVRWCLRTVPPTVMMLCGVVAPLSSASAGTPGTFEATGTMNDARYSHTATVLQNGKVLVAGGFGSSILRSSETYDPASGNWTYTAGNLNTSRYGHTATLLPNGKVFVVGGKDALGNSLESGELFDPASGTWTNTLTMAAGRSGHTATLLPNGKVLVAGGYDSASSHALDTAELFDPATGNWTAAGNMAVRREHHTATLLRNGKVLVAGGDTTTNTAELYDPSTNTWTTTGSLVTGRTGHTATLLPDGKVLVAAGYNNADTTSNGRLASAELYDPSTGKWTATGSLNAPRLHHTATLLSNNKVLVTGGELGGTSYLASAELYDIASATWSKTGSMSTARVDHTATLLGNDNVLVAGGSMDGNNSATAMAEVYNSPPLSTAVGSMNSARASHSATLLPNGKVLVAGGVLVLTNTYLASAELYDPATGTWSPTGNLATARGDHTATLLPSGKVLVTGGHNKGSSYLTSAELYDPTTGKWSNAGNLAVARYYHTATLLSTGKVLVAGGYGGTALQSSELYDPATGGWSSTGGLTNGRYVHTATLLSDGRVLVAGGSNGSSLNSAELYDPATGAWTATGNLTGPRDFHTATLLPNGKVLAAGGHQTAGGSFAATTTAELYDPSTGLWKGTGNLVSARYRHTATLLPTGELLLTGGSTSSGGSTASCEVYNLDNGSWTRAGSLLANRVFDTATLLANGKILVAGGSNSNTLATAELLTREPNHPFRGTGGLATPRSGHTATLLLNGKVLVTGGRGDSGRLASTELFDPATGTWSSAGNLSSVRSSHTATLLRNGKVLVVGGFTLTGLSNAAADLYDPATGTWSVTGSLATPRYGHSATLLADGRVLVAGGDDANAVSLKSAEVYDPATGAWSSAGNMAQARFEHSATLLPNGDVLVAGGDANGHNGPALATAELFHPISGSWTVTASLSQARLTHPATLLPNGKVLVAGGNKGSNSFISGTASCELYDPTTGTWSPTGNLNTFHTYHRAVLLLNGTVLVIGGTQGPAEIYEPALGSWSIAGPNAARSRLTATLLPDGDVLVAGGVGNIFQGTTDFWEALPSSIRPEWRPQLETATAPLLSGDQLKVTGSRFKGISQASYGTGGDSSTNYPIVQLRRLDNEEVNFFLADPAHGWSASSFNSLPVGSLPFGPALVTVFTNGIPSNSKYVLIGPAIPSLTTHASGKTTVGNSIKDMATIVGGINPSGTVMFKLYGPDNATCGGAPIYSSVVTVGANGTATSGAYKPSVPGSYRWVASYSGDSKNERITGSCNAANESVLVSAAPTPTPTARPTPTPTPKPTPTPTPKPTPTPASLGNISTRLRVETGDNALIGGFIVTGTQPKKVLVRAIGPSLPVNGRLSDPTLALYHGSTLLETNDNWVDSANKQAIIDTTIPPSNSRESAIVRTLPANSSAYTAVVRGVNNGTGVGLVEVYDLDRSVDSKLANISTRGLVQTGDNAMIGGFIVLDGAQNVIVRAIGPSLPVTGALQNPVLELHDHNGAVIQANDDWRSDQEAAIIATTVPPKDSRESAIVRRLVPGNYTAVVRGVNNTTGVALVEVFALQ